eukprot:6183412-Pleurochrysis_carterae.AAC.1
MTARNKGLPSFQLSGAALHWLSYFYVPLATANGVAKRGQRPPDKRDKRNTKCLPAGYSSGSAHRTSAIIAERTKVICCVTGLCIAEM